jgi:hypothetical protein
MIDGLQRDNDAFKMFFGVKPLFKKLKSRFFDSPRWFGVPRRARHTNPKDTVARRFHLSLPLSHFRYVRIRNRRIIGIENHSLELRKSVAS